MTVTPGNARHYARTGHQLGQKILRLFTFAMIGMFIGMVLGIAFGPF